MYMAETARRHLKIQISRDSLGGGPLGDQMEHPRPRLRRVFVRVFSASRCFPSVVPYRSANCRFLSYAYRQRSWGPRCKPQTDYKLHEEEEGNCIPYVSAASRDTSSRTSLPACRAIGDRSLSTQCLS